MAYIYDLTDTWNAGGTTFNAIKMNVTDSASAVTSKLVSLQTNGTEHFSVTKAGVGYFSGNVGIGTSSVSAVFGTTVKVYNAGNGGTLQLSGSTVNAYFFASEGLGRSTLGNSSNHPLTFITNDTERMRIDSTGNVGIGTTSPTGRFAVVGSAVGAGIFSVDTDATRVDIQSYNKPLAINRQGNNTLLNEGGGNVGIGTASPGTRLDVRGVISGGDGTIQTVVSYLAAAGVTGTVSNHPYVLYANNAERMRIDATGNVGIGTTSTFGFKQAINAGASTSGQIIISTTTGVYTNYSDGSATNSPAVGGIGNNLVFATGAVSNTEAARIDSSGNLLVGRTSTSGLGKLNVEGGADFTGGNVYLARDTGNVFVGKSSIGSEVTTDGAIFYRNASGGGMTTYLTNGGNGTVLAVSTQGDTNAVIFFRSGSNVGSIAVTTTATSYNTSSDYRLKDIDGPIANSGAYIDALKPVQGSWKADGSRFIGLLAHEAQEVSETPIATGEKDGEEMQAMDYSAPEIIANLIAEIQSLRARVAQLEGN